MTRRRPSRSGEPGRHGTAAPSGPVRRVRRPVRARGAGRGARRARRGAAARPRSTRRSSGELGPPAPHLHRAGRACSPRCRRFAAARRRRAGPAQARGPQPHRLAQDQQRARPGAAHQADGQDPGHRRDRRRPARRRHRHRRRAARASSASSTWARRTPGGRRSTSPGCGCSAPRSSRSAPAARTLKDAINEAMRDWVTNVDDHPLPARHRHRPAPVPRDGPRLPPGHRRRGPRPGARAGRPAARRGRAPASAAAPTPWASSTASSTTRRCA